MEATDSKSLVILYMRVKNGPEKDVQVLELTRTKYRRPNEWCKMSASALQRKEHWTSQEFIYGMN